MTSHQLGSYQVVCNVETPECSLRLLRLTEKDTVRPHHHHQTTQTYFLIQGKAEVTTGNETTLLESYETLRVPIDTVHTIRSIGEALVLSISIPPLDPSDQHVAAQR